MRLPMRLTTDIFVLLSLAALLGCVGPGVSGPFDDLQLLFNISDQDIQIETDAPPIFRSRSIFTQIPGMTGSHAPTLTAFEDGELLGAWYSYPGHDELIGSAIYMARKLPDSDQWDPPAVHIDRPEGDGNPVLYSEGDQVWLFQAVVPFGWSLARIEVQRSTDRGYSWSEPQAIDGPVGSNTRFPPVRTASGTLLLPAYSDLHICSLLFSSTDGDDWSLRSVIATPLPFGSIQPSVVHLGDDRLLAVMRNTGGGWLWAAASGDQGQSWSRPIDTNFANPDSPAAMLRLAGGNLALIFNDSRTERSPLSVAISPDEGLTWSAGKVIVDGDLKYSYPAAAQTPDGLIHIVYSHNRETIRHVTINEAWIVSDD